MSSSVAVAWLAAAILVVVWRCEAFQRFQERIPNAGDSLGPVQLVSNVPAPFGVVDRFCMSVGHLGNCTGPPSGGGNPFGVDFLANGGMWNDTICKMDSDGDGILNAEEVGDPQCVFMPGLPPAFLENISHPGYACSTPADPFCLLDPAPTGVPVTWSTGARLEMLPSVAMGVLSLATLAMCGLLS